MAGAGGGHTLAGAQQSRRHHHSMYHSTTSCDRQSVGSAQGGTYSRSMLTVLVGLLMPRTGQICRLGAVCLSICQRPSTEGRPTYRNEVHAGAQRPSQSRRMQVQGTYHSTSGGRGLPCMAHRLRGLDQLRACQPLRLPPFGLGLCLSAFQPTCSSPAHPQTSPRALFLFLCIFVGTVVPPVHTPALCFFSL